MAKTADWRQVDDYYWAGPDGWTICKVWVSGAHQFELWRPGARVFEEMLPSLKAAQSRYTDLAAA